MILKFPNTHSLYVNMIYFNPHYHRRIWVIFEGGPMTSSCQNLIPSLPAKISSCQGGHVFCQAAVPSFSAKLSCQSYKLSSAKLQASQFCSAKLPFLSCQAQISVLPSTHFCPAKLDNFSTPMDEMPQNGSKQIC